MFWFIITVVLVITFRKEIVSLFSPIGAFVSNIAGRIKEKMTPTPEQAAIKAKEKEVQAKFVRNLSETEELYKIYVRDYSTYIGLGGEYIRFYLSDGNVIDRLNDGLWSAVRRFSDISLIVTRDETGEILRKEFNPMNPKIYY